jgi:cellulose synthase/poly-beta-1,6-N-acetylglucosamine synthase-like glycosyltransferase
VAPRPGAGRRHPDRHLQRGGAILERTIVGALAVRHPNTRVWVLDDARRPWLRHLCARLGARYLTRADNAHAKAGNINAAFGVLRTLAEPPDFVAVLDADFVPHRDFLDRALALFHDRASAWCRRRNTSSTPTRSSTTSASAAPTRTSSASSSTTSSPPGTRGASPSVAAPPR